MMFNTSYIKLNTRGQISPLPFRKTTAATKEKNSKPKMVRQEECKTVSIQAYAVNKDNSQC